MFTGMLKRGISRLAYKSLQKQINVDIVKDNFRLVREYNILKCGSMVRTN